MKLSNWLLALATILPSLVLGATTPHVALWDSVTRTSDHPTFDKRSTWKQVPTDLFSLEAEPAKASSDPGYYGRGYSFQGDAVVETPSLIALFSSARGSVLIYCREIGSPDAQPQQIAEVVFAASNRQIQSEIVRNAGDEVVLACGSGEGVGVSFAFDKLGILEIKPSPTSKEGISVLSPIKHAILPDFIGDDLIYSATAHASDKELSVPAENVLVGLLQGGRRQLVLTWPDQQHKLKLRLNAKEGTDRLIEAVDIQPAGGSFYLGALCATNLWHEEALKPAYLEKDVALQWKRPFPAKWETQLDEADVRTTFAIRPAKGQVWRGVAGSYIYPVWFDGDTAFCRFTKKVPPKGNALIYFLEGQGTPLSILTPVDMMKATLGRSVCDAILDPPGRNLRTHHRASGSGVHRGCTCGFTEAIQAVFEAGQETAKKEYVAAAVDDMIFFIQCHLDRIDEYKRFAEELTKVLRARGEATPTLKPYLESLDQIVQQIPQEITLQQENMKSLGHAGELARQTMALTGKKAASNLSEYMELLKAWRAMGGAQDYVVARCHSIVRKLHQTAGYTYGNQPEALTVAKEIRVRCRQCLRNPDGYEIWGDY